MTSATSVVKYWVLGWSLVVINIFDALSSLSTVFFGSTGSVCFTNSGPVNHFEFKSLGTEIGLVPISAGLHLAQYSTWPGFRKSGYSVPSCPYISREYICSVIKPVQRDFTIGEI